MGNGGLGIGWMSRATPMATGGLTVVLFFWATARHETDMPILGDIAIG